MTKGSKTVDIDVNLGVDLRAKVRKQAKAWGISEEEFICNALESKVRNEADCFASETFVRHGGKHLFGKHTGYEVTKDGRYYPAPTWVDQFAQLAAERSAIHNMINVVIATAQTRLVEVEKRIHKTQVDLIADIGLDPAKNWGYYGGEKCLKEILEDDGEQKKEKK